ncbi:MAG: helix-turn-helix domain-containing protein [Chloroflexi bacterium]|nr:helix-turn-helix domain-containing protein [Chloroflexota bacterium]
MKQENGKLSQQVYLLSGLGLRAWLGNPSLMPGPHRHSEIELNFVCEGTITYLHRDTLITIPAGRLALFWAAIPHQLVEGHTSTYYFVTIPLETFLAWKLPQPFTQALLFGDLIMDDGENTIYNQLLLQRWYADLGGDRAFIALMEIEARLWRLALDTRQSQLNGHPPPGHTTHSKASQMAKFIVEHYDEPLTVEAISTSVGLHPNYAMQLFKRVFGLSLLEYVIQYRVAQAQRLLATTDDNVLTIAIQTGFGSSSNFYMAFKKYCGQSPNTYRYALRRTV